jgi:lipoic acid synthetase
MEIIIQEIPSAEGPHQNVIRKPEWLKARVPGGESYSRLKNMIDERKLHTVCEEARCPNMGECWNAGTATFMILGDTCTRSCGFCNVKTGKMHLVDEDEPRRVGEAVELMNLRHAVITSVNRDELFDGGAHIFANTIQEIRKRLPICRVEVLIPDFMGSEESLNIVLDAQPMY